MVDLPRVPRNLVTTQTPQSTVSADAIAQQGKWLGDALTKIGAVVEDVAVAQAQQAGQKAVTIGPDGQPQVSLMPMFTGKAGQAYNNAARESYDTQFDAAARELVQQKRLEYEGKPDEFKQWFSGYQETLVTQQPAEIQGRIRNRLTRLGSEVHNSLVVGKYQNDVRRDLAATDAELDNVKNDLELIARNGGVGTEGWDERMSRLDELLAKKVAHPAFVYPPEKAGQFRDAVLSGAVGQETIAGVERVYLSTRPGEGGYDAARAHLAETVKALREGGAGDVPESMGRYGLKMRDIDRIEREGMKWLKAQESGLRGARSELSRRWSDVNKNPNATADDMLQIEREASAIGHVSVASQARTSRLALGTMTNLRGLPGGVRSEIARTGVVPAGVVDRIIGVESGGNPAARNPASSASGLGQFTNATWLATVQKHRPDLLEGRSTAEVLALRTPRDNSPEERQRAVALNREMTASLANDNTASLQAAGVPVTAGSVYLAHFLGPAGAARVFRAPGHAPSASVADAAAVSANKGIFAKNPTAADLIAWADRKMGGAVTGGAGEPDAVPVRSMSLIDTPWGARAWRNLVNEERKGLAADLADFEREERKLSLPSMEEIERLKDRAIAVGTPEQKERVAQLMLQAREGEKFQSMTAPAREAAVSAIKEELKGGGDKYQREMRDKLDAANTKITAAYKSDPYGAHVQYGKGQALVPLDIMQPNAAAVVAAKEQQREQIMDEQKIPWFPLFRSAEARDFRGHFFSADPQRVAAAASFASNLLARDQNAFVGMENAERIEKEALAFRHYVDDLGMGAEEAAQQLVVDRTPEHKSAVKAQIKQENITELVKKRLSVSDLSGTFDESIMPLSAPNIGFTQTQRGEMYRHYAELVQDFYGENGNIDLSKKLAQAQLKRVWGVSSVSGSATVMPYPPERSPQAHGIENASDLIADDAVASIKAELGLTVPRGKIGLMPIPGSTAAAFKSGAPVPYNLIWSDDQGVIRTLNPGKAYVVDGAALRERQSQNRAQLDEQRRRAGRGAPLGLPAPDNPYSGMP